MVKSMSLKDIIEKTLSSWMRDGGPEADVVLSTRTRVARNLNNVPFPHVASDADLKGVVDTVRDALKRSPALAGLYMLDLAEVSLLDRQILVEKHLVSPQHIGQVKNRAVVLRKDEVVSIMINEEDHIRIQTIFPGFQLERAWELCSEIDDGLERGLDYAFDEKIGYLTACPTNVGTGLRASIMMHLPALAMTNQVGRVLSSVSHLGIAVRGLYGEGTESSGNIYQLSNQVTLGRTEQDILENIKGVARQIIDQERGARGYLLRETRKQLEDRVYRAYGILANARMITSEEALRLLSDVRLGIDTNLIPGIDRKIFNELMVLTRPAYLQKLMGRELSPPERDVERASFIRERVKEG